MLSDLFNDPNNESNESYKVYSCSNNSIDKPSPKRKIINLSGIVNQGATCYLNTLIQTLYLTPEFRENLFSLNAVELGLVPSTNGSNRLRVIPIELQRLFAQLMILDQEACSTNRLTDSFGWTNNEELQQHDVQELNRILFAAIEQSLVNTKQSKLIQELYRGTYVNKIKCLACLNIVQREEEYLDIPITVQGSANLHTSLINSFQLREHLSGSNQYRCENCNNQYQDAEKYCQLKTLPPILTFSLLRFTYDLQTFQRIKETSSFEFPLELELRDYMEDSFKAEVPPEYSEYELFSVIIHSGSAYGGHYHNYIKDMENIGNWVFSDQTYTKTSEEKNPKEKNESSMKIDENLFEKKDLTISLICCDNEDEPSFTHDTNEMVNLDYLKYDTPSELLKAFIYNKHKYNEVRIEAVCADLTKVTGISWNKRFKAKYGPIEKFFRKNDETFELMNESKYVKLKTHDRINIIASSNYSNNVPNELIKNCLEEVDEAHTKKDANKSNTPSLAACSTIDEFNEYENEKKETTHHWFDFDDSRVTPILASKIKKQFEGKESAYMLFYRRKQLRSQSVKSDHMKKIPDWLLNELQEENLKLNEKRLEYENKINSFSIECYLENDFYLDQNVLNLHQQFESKSIKLDVDKRKTNVNDLKEAFIYNLTTPTNSNEMQARKEACLNILLDDAPFYWLLCNRVDTSVSKSSNGRYSYYIKSLLNNYPEKNLFELINSETASQKCLLVLSKHCDVWPIGDDYMPIRIVIKYFDKQFEINEISYTFTKCTLIKQIKEIIVSDYLGNKLMSSENEATLESSRSLIISLIKNNKTKTDEKIFLSTELNDHKSLGDLMVKNGDFITIEADSMVNQSYSDKLKNITNKDLYKSINSNSNLCSIVKSVSEINSDLNFQATQPDYMHELNILNCTNVNSNDTKQNAEISASGLELIKNIKIILESSLNLNNFNYEDCHLRLINEEEDELRNETSLMNKILNVNTASSDSITYSYPGICLHDDANLNEVLQANRKFPNGIVNASQKLILLLCPGKAPIKSNNEIMVRFLKESHETNSHSSQGLFFEVLINTKQCRVIDLTNMITSKMKLEPIESDSNEQYYLKTVDWFGDAESVLNNFELCCEDVPLIHNDLVLVSKGQLVPPNHFKIRIWISIGIKEIDLSNELASSCSLSDESDKVILNDFIETKYKEFKFLDELIVKNEMKLENLKSEIQNSLKLKAHIDQCDNIRLRLLKKIVGSNSEQTIKEGETNIKFQMKKTLIDFHKPLKQLHLNQENDLCVQILSEENDCLNQGTLLIDSIRFDLNTRLCFKKSFKQIIWNVNNGATLNSLKESILKAYSDELQQSDLFKLSIAKYLIGKCQWILLKEINNNSENTSNSSNANQKKKKKPNSNQTQQTKSNLRQAPFNLDDGDLIAFTLDRPNDNKQIVANDFMSTEDLSYSKKMNITAAEISRLKKERRIMNDPLGLGSGDAKKTNRRPELGITIKIDDFNY